MAFQENCMFHASISLFSTLLEYITVAPPYFQYGHYAKVSGEWESYLAPIHYLFKLWDFCHSRNVHWVSLWSRDAMPSLASNWRQRGSGGVSFSSSQSEELFPSRGVQTTQVSAQPKPQAPQKINGYRAEGNRGGLRAFIELNQSIGTLFS